jgi:hypothetical protein
VTRWKYRGSRGDFDVSEREWPERRVSRASCLSFEVGGEDGLEAAVSSVLRLLFQLMHAEFKQPCCQL